MDIPKEESVIFNTHAYVKKLMAAGMPEAQAEAQMEIFIQFIDTKLATKSSLENYSLALKKDIKELEKATTQSIKELEKATTQSIKELDLKLSTQMKVLEKDITIKLGSMIVVGVTILGAMIKFF